MHPPCAISSEACGRAGNAWPLLVNLIRRAVAGPTVTGAKSNIDPKIDHCVRGLLTALDRGARRKLTLLPLGAVHYSADEVALLNLLSDVQAQHLAAVKARLAWLAEPAVHDIALGFIHCLIDECNVGGLYLPPSRIVNAPPSPPGSLATVCADGKEHAARA